MKDKLQKDMIQAMKDKDVIKKETLRLIISEIKNEKIKQKKELEVSDIIKIIKRGVKIRKESIELYKQGNRDDLTQKAQKEIEVLEEYLPKQLSEVELDKIILDTIKETGAQGPKDTGKVIKAIMSEYGSQTNGKTVQQLVFKKLSA